MNQFQNKNGQISSSLWKMEGQLDMMGLNMHLYTVKDRIKSTIYEEKTAFVLHYLYPPKS